MPAVQDLHGRRSAFLDATFVLGRTVSANDPDGRMLFKPSGERPCGAVGQELYGAVPLEVHDDRPVAPAAQQGEVVDTDRLGCRIGGGRGAPDVAQQGRGARRWISRAPASPLSAKPTSLRTSCRRAVLRAYGSTREGRRSVKIRRGHPILGHLNFRTLRSSLTRRPLQGRSATLRR